MNEDTANILEKLRALPPCELSLTMRNPRGRFERRFRGVLLADYAAAAGLIVSGLDGADLADAYFIARANDGFRVAVAGAEVASHFTHKQVLLAYEQDGEALEVGVRLVVPGDDLGGRSILGLTAIELHRIEKEAVEPVSAGFRLAGLLEHPGVVDAVQLAEHARVRVETPTAPRAGTALVPGKAYEGVRLYDLIEAAGPRLDEGVHEDFLNKVVVVRSADGFSVVLASGEIEPRFMNGDAVIASEEDGSFRLVVPYDASVGRCLKNVACIELVAG